MRAERLTGYFWTSASKRAASSGEKIDLRRIVIYLGSFLQFAICTRDGCCISSRAHCFSGQIHCFLRQFAAQSSGFGEFHRSAASIFSRPGDDCVMALEDAAIFRPWRTVMVFSAASTVGLTIAIEAVSRGVAAKQGGERNPELGKMRFVVSQFGGFDEF